MAFFIAIYCLNGFVHPMGRTTDDGPCTFLIFLHKQWLFLEFWFMLSFQCACKILNRLIINAKITELLIYKMWSSLLYDLK